MSEVIGEVVKKLGVLEGIKREDLLSGAELEARIEELRAKERAYCESCRDLSACQYNGSRGYRPKWGEETTYEECSIHRAWGVKVRTERLFRESRIPVWARGADLERAYAEGEPSEALKALHRVYLGIERELKVVGVRKSGKTLLLSALGGSLIRRGEVVAYRTASEVVNELRWGSEVYAEASRELKSVPYLLLDDLGSERRGEYQEEELRVVVESRSRGGLVTVVGMRPGEKEYRGRLGEWVEVLRGVEIK